MENRSLLAAASFAVPPNDPLFSEQWNLQNTGQTGGTPGADINVLPVWSQGDLGQGATVGVVDSGVYFQHPDLIANYRPDLSYNFFNNTPNPTPPLGPFLTPTGSVPPLPPNFQGGEDSHGTAVAGIIAASGNNGIGVTGIAPDAQFGAIRAVTQDANGNLTQGGDKQFADALSFQNQKINIYNNSWGSIPQGGPESGILGAPDPLTVAAMQKGDIGIPTANPPVIAGRGGLGNIYVFSAGNGGNPFDPTQPIYGQRGYQNTNDEAETASRFAVTVSALGDDGKEAVYSAYGASVLVSAPGGHNGIGAANEVGIPSTSVLAVNDPNNPGQLTYEPTYLDDSNLGMNGTSAAAPNVSGVVALMLSANPNLSWRDVQEILAETATKNDPTDSGWFGNGFGYTSDGAIVPVDSAGNYAGSIPLPANVTVSPFHINDKYGFGEVNATAAVNLARIWTPLQAEDSVNPVSSGVVTANQAIPDGVAQGVSDSVTFTSGIHVEHAQLILNITHPQRGDIEVILTAPNGTRSVMQATRSFETPNGDVTYDATLNASNQLVANANYTNWSTNSVQDWGMSSGGTWTVTVADQDANGKVGTLNSFQLNLYGTQDYAPVAQDFTVSDQENQTASFNVLSHTYDVDGTYTIAPGSLAIASQPANGTLSVNPQTGQIVYTPNFGFHGVDTFTYTVHDNNGSGVSSRAATVTIDVGQVNSAPVANNDVTSTKIGTPVAINVLANDTDASGTLVPSTVTIVSQPSFGSVSVNSTTGVVTYTPGPNFTLSDSFQYTVSDTNNLTSNAATVTINLTQSAPVASSFSQPPANENVTQQINVLGHVTGSVNPSSVTILTAPLHGTAKVDPITGVINYTPQANFFGTDSLTYVAANFQGSQSNAAVVNLTVLSQGIPLALNHEFILVPGQTLIDGVRALDDPSNTGALTAVLVSQAHFGTVALNANGTFTYAQGANFPGVDSFNYLVNNGQANSNVATIRLVTPNFHYVEQLYRDVLNRTASDGEILSWTALLNAGVSRSQIAAGFLGSPEYLTSFINNSYEQILSRGVDFSGLNYWLGQLEAGLSLEQFLATLYGSPEYAAQHGGTPQAIVVSLYQSILSRGASLPEINFWADQIVAGAPVGGIALLFLQSPEYRADLFQQFNLTYIGTPVSTAAADYFVASFGPSISRLQIQIAVLASNSYFGHG